MSDSTPPVQGLVAGKYQILGLIGRGGMGSVWEGRHTSLGTRVAIKFIDQEYADSPEACARFVTEARAAATIQSKHAIQIFDHGVGDNGRPYMVMELLEGEPLDRRLERVGTLSLAETARIIGHVCRALQRAHDAGIIHRDLKPENIFLVRTPDDDDEIAKVLDFGIAKIKGPPGGEGMSSSTKTGAVLGTPYYMSPEQARGLRNIDHRSDLWSLGVIAHKCVTGVLPFEGESVGDLLVKICTSPLPTPSVTVPGLPASFDAWFFRALEREPARRFGRASELSDHLAFAAGLSTRGASSSQDGIRFTPQAPAASMNPRSPRSPSATLSSEGVTSAPFTASAAPRPRGALFVAVAAALVGASIGVVAVVKMASTTPAAVAAPATATATAAMAADAAPPKAAPAVVAAATVPALETSAPPSRPAPSPPTATTSLGSPRPKAVAPPPPPATTTAPPAPARPPPSKPSPNPADPGY
jgi:eukaryotic-like serine/threonine-protein kinase